MPAEDEGILDPASALAVEPAGRKPSPCPDPEARLSESVVKGVAGEGKAPVPSLEGSPPHRAEHAGASGWGDPTADAPQDELTPVLHANPLTDDEDPSSSPRASTSAAAPVGADRDAPPGAAGVGEGYHATGVGDPTEGTAPDAAPASASSLPPPARPPPRGEPPLIKSLPSANSAFAIEVLQGLASGSPKARADRARAFQLAVDDAAFAAEQSAAGAAAARDAEAAAEEAATCLAAEHMLEGASSVGHRRPGPFRSAPVLNMCPSVTPAVAMNHGYYTTSLSHSPPPRVLSPPQGYYQGMAGMPALGYAMAHPPAQRSPVQATRMPPPPAYTYPQQVITSPVFASSMLSDGQHRKWSRAPPQQAQPFSLPASSTVPAPSADDTDPAEDLVEEGPAPRPASAGKRPRAKKGTEADEGKAAAVTPWRPSEDSTILQGVAEAGCKWSLIAQKLPGRSDNAVRNRWHRLEKAERQRREALQAGRPVEGYRCRKCGHFKKGHMCLGLETVSADGTVMPSPSQRPGTNPPPAKRGRPMMMDPRLASQLSSHLTQAMQPGYASLHGHMPQDYYAPSYAGGYRDYDDYGPLSIQASQPQHLVYVQPHHQRGHHPLSHQAGYSYAAEHGYAPGDAPGAPLMKTYLSSDLGGPEHHYTPPHPEH